MTALQACRPLWSLRKMVLRLTWNSSESQRAEAWYTKECRYGPYTDCGPLPLCASCQKSRLNCIPSPTEGSFSSGRDFLPHSLCSSLSISSGPMVSEASSLSMKSA